LGWQVSSAASHEEAVARLQRPASELPDVLILNRASQDANMATAVTALRTALKAHPCQIVVMTSTFEHAALVGTAEAALVDAFLTRPVTTSTLYNAVIAARSKAGDVPAASARASGDALAGIRLLVVDDSEINRDVAQRILSREGAEVRLAEDGQAAIDWLLDHPSEIDLVLMDVQMPVLDGITACTMLRALPQFAALPIVALTAGAFSEQHEAARAAGMSDFIAKPFDIPLTIATILRLCRCAPAAPPAVIDVAQGVILWEDMGTYSVYLRKFEASYHDAPAVLQAALAGGEHQQGAAFAHKLAGAAANVALPALARQALDVERCFAGEGAPGSALAALQGELARALAEIARIAPVPCASSEAPLRSDIDVHVLLGALLAALHTDNPAPALPLLAQLRQAVAAADCAEIEHAVQQYDFRQAERATRALAARVAQTTVAAP
jgi:CheY-like chemotaxis protein